MERVLGASLDELWSTRTSVKWRRWPRDVVPAWVAEMDALPCPAVVEAVSAAMARGDTGYTWVRPYAEAAGAFAKDRWGWSFDPSRARSAPDVMIGILDVLRVLTGPGDAVVVSSPVYNAFYGFIEGYGRRVVEAPLDDRFRLDPAALDRAFGEATREGRRAAYLLCNPHNPTGTVHTAAELAALAALAHDHGVRVVADEIHAPLVLPGATFTPYATVPGGERAVTLFSASKAWNLAGLKCALAIPGGEADDVMRAIPEVATHGASHVAAIAHTAALTDGCAWLDELVRELDENRHHLARRLAAQAPGVAYRPPEATYLAWLDLRASGLGDDPAAALVRSARVGLSSGPEFGTQGRGFARLNFATAPEVLDIVLDRLVGGLSGGEGAALRPASGVSTSAIPPSR